MEEAGKNGKVPWLALFTIVIGSFMALLVSSSINVALPKLMAIFGVNATSIQWVVTAYTLVSGVIVPITGYLSMRFGGKRVYLLAVLIFTIGSALCTLAWNNNSLVVARVIQGIGGGMIAPVGMSIVYLIVPREKMGLAMGVYGISVTVAPAIGPTVGGYLVDHLSWHWLFIINIPIGLASLFFSSLLLKETSRRSDLKPDVLGIILCSAACFALLLALSQGREEGWDSLYIVNLFIFAGFTLTLFVIWELIIPEPLINLKLLNNRTFCVSLLSAALMTIALYAGSFFIPLYAQTARGYTPMETGLMMMPAAVVMALMMPVSGRLFDKIGAMPLCMVGFAITAYATYVLHNLSLSTSFSSIQVILIFRSMGLGLAMMPLSTVGMNTIPRLMVSQGASLNTLVRMISISLGIPILTTVMSHRQAYHTAWLSDAVNYASPVAVTTVNKLGGLLFLSGIPKAYTAQGALALIYKTINLNAFIQGIDDSFIVSAVLMAAAIPLGLFLRKKAAEAETEKQHQQFLDVIRNTD